MKIKEKPTCINCGAPLKGLKCEYCGTEYDKTTKMKNDSLSYLLQAGGISVKTAMILFGGINGSNI